MRVCVIISAYNEEAVIASVVEDVISTFGKAPYESKVVVVDDHSRDQTAKVAVAAGAQVITHIINTGHGGAVSTGIRFAERENCDVAVIMDGDGQHLAKDSLNGVKKIIERKDDLLVGSRLVDKMSDEKMSQVKRFGNNILNFVTHALFGVSSTDSQSGLRVFSRLAIEKLRWKSTGYEFCSEMLWRAKQLKLQVGEFPIEIIYTDYSLAKGQNNWNGINIIKSLIKYRVKEIFQ